MRTGYKDCKHCGTTYTVQFSGDDVTGIPKIYQDFDYCPECKKSIVLALEQVPVKYEYQSVRTDEVDLATLQKWEKEYLDEMNKKGSNLSKRIFAHVYNVEAKEHNVIEQVIGREDKTGRVYVYSYWPSKPEEVIITVRKKINLITNEPVGYEIRR